MTKAIIYTVVGLVVIVIGNFLLPVPLTAIEVAAEPIFHIGSFVVTNAFFTSFLISLILLIVAFILGRNLKERPGGFTRIFRAGFRRGDMAEVAVIKLT